MGGRSPHARAVLKARNGEKVESIFRVSCRRRTKYAAANNISGSLAVSQPFRFQRRHCLRIAALAVPRIYCMYPVMCNICGGFSTAAALSFWCLLPTCNRYDYCISIKELLIMATLYVKFVQSIESEIHWRPQLRRNGNNRVLYCSTAAPCIVVACALLREKSVHVCPPRSRPACSLTAPRNTS